MTYYNMSLLASNTFASPGQPLYGNGGGGGTSTATQFTATGIANSGGFVSTGAGGNVTLKQGVFETTAVIDPLTETVDVMRIQTAAGLNRWQIGIENEEIGGNAGSNLYVLGCDDAGDPLVTALEIARSSGNVVVPFGELIANGGATVGALSTPEGGVLTIRGDAGSARVYDPIYNPVPPLSNFLASFTSAAIQGAQASGSVNVGMGSFTVPTTGLYLLSARLTVNVLGGPTQGCTVGDPDFLSVFLTTSPPTVGLANASSTFLRPISMAATDFVVPGEDYSVCATNALVLTEGVTYIMTGQIYNGSATLSFPATGTAGQLNGRIIPLLANTAP